MNGEPEAKRKTLREVTIGTHNGTFHCDEVLASFMLKQLPEYKEARIIRSRDQSVLDTCDVVVDVGGVYDPKKHRYDHHQRSFTETMHSLNEKKPWVTPLSSAGLVYLHFGHRIIASILDKKDDDFIVQTVYDKVYENFIEEIDAIDNGVSTHDEKPRYRITTNLSSRVAGLNPQWNDADSDTEKRFYRAYKMVGEELIHKVQYYSLVWWPARKLVQAAINTRYEVDLGGEIIEFESGGCPWKDHLFTLEEETGLEPTVKFILFADQKGNWRVQAVPIRLGSFENRVSLLEEWRGLRDEVLSEKSGIPNCTFVHNSGFIGGNQTRDGVLQMARITLEKQNQS